MLDSSDFKTVWEVVRALRSHDERVDYWVNDPRVASPIIIHPPRPEDPEIVSDSELAEQGELQLQFVKRLEDAVASKIVQECGDKQMWPTWGQRAAEVCKRVGRKTASLIGEPSCQAAFDEFVAAMREAVGAHLTPTAAQQMVAHHIVTIPVFDHLFADAQFAARNPISRAINQFLDALARSSRRIHNRPRSVQRRPESSATCSSRLHAATAPCKGCWRTPTALLRPSTCSGRSTKGSSFMP